jgi:hypothetical protein
MQYDTQTIILFNKQANEFLTKMALTFPNEPKTKTYKYMFEHIKQINMRTPVEIFMENLRPFGLQIMSKNEEFFKEDQYVNHVESISGKMGLIKYWESLPDETKVSIWNYMQVLYVLGMKSLGLKEELARTIEEAKVKAS